MRDFREPPESFSKLQVEGVHIKRFQDGEDLALVRFLRLGEYAEQVPVGRDHNVDEVLQVQCEGAVAMPMRMTVYVLLNL